MIDPEARIRVELEQLLPLPDGERADWGDVLDRAGARSRRAGIRARHVAVLVAIVALLAGVGTAVGLGFDLMAELNRVDRNQWAAPEMRPTVGRVEVARGADWSFVAWPTREGVCVAYAAGAVTDWAIGCGRRPLPGDDPAASDFLITALITPGDDGAVVGAVTADVARVELQLTDGRVLSAPAEPARGALGTGLHLFMLRTVLPAPPSPVGAYLLYGPDGTLLERFAPE